MSLDALWNGQFKDPVFVLTSDQDWASEWAMNYWIKKIDSYKIPLHLFRTNPCNSLTNPHPLISQGWHPNFLPGSSHGNNIEEVLAYFKENFPNLYSVRSHAFVEDTFKWKALSEVGIMADSQVLTAYQPYILPINHWTGMVRFPIYFEDDIFLNDSDEFLSLDILLPTLFSPGLKIFNFHATFIANNIPSMNDYFMHKDKFFELNGHYRFTSRGIDDVFDELITLIHAKGFKFISFEQLVKRCL